MAETHFPGNSTKTLPGTVGRHDGHQDGHLNCLALRHGWTRTFSISPEELAVIDYDTLERILEVNTLRIRPMALRIFIEQPVDSGSWSKIRPWKNDNSLQSILVQKHFEERRASGAITRFEVRDGADRRDESDSLSLRAVGSRIVHGMHHRGETTSSSTGTAGGQGGSWLGTLIKRRSTTTRRVSKKKNSTSTDNEDEDEAGDDQAPEPPAKQDSRGNMTPPPYTPHVVPPTLLYQYFNLYYANFRQRRYSATSTLSPSSPAEVREAEVEQLRKRGWMPPGLARRQKSLQDRLRAAEGRNPFLGGSRVYRGKKSSAGNSEVDNPFADPDAQEITPQDVDEFFEIDRTSSIVELNNRPVHKTWSRLKGGKNKKNKGKQKQELGGAEIVRQPEDAFPDSPHHSKHSLNKFDDEE
ncbi:hypothetical protein FB45DRAFT_747621 [Roridomyces roridus]|uniref:Uncharacterized protein n=1 Tax=Roridomyces roridus TaxID=1738132 RepID=A0AAD7BUW4_9AGAR|nr:hypothetical protein FB45DRAFT_747621 [Roridomyces roridus]